MDTYSVVVSIYGWTIKNTRTGKTLSGTMEKLPHGIFMELIDYATPADRSICTARSISVPYTSKLSQWFRLTY